MPTNTTLRSFDHVYVTHVNAQSVTHVCARCPPRPSPPAFARTLRLGRQGEGGSSPIGRRIVCPGNVRGPGGASPSPRGEGRGEGEWVLQHTSASETKDPCKNPECHVRVGAGIEIGMVHIKRVAGARTFLSAAT